MNSEQTVEISFVPTAESGSTEVSSESLDALDSFLEKALQENLKYRIDQTSSKIHCVTLLCPISQEDRYVGELKKAKFERVTPLSDMVICSCEGENFFSNIKAKSVSVRKSMPDFLQGDL